MRLVLDTNVIVSALFFGGKPKELISTIFNKNYELYATEDIIQEYKNVVKILVEKYRGHNVVPAFDSLLSIFKIIKTNTYVEICRDKDDNKFIDCAIEIKAKYIISGDKDLLDIKNYRNISIITVDEFLKKQKEE